LKDCWCLKDPARYFYIGRVKFEFHADCKEVVSHHMGSGCKGLWPHGISYGIKKYPWYHPHIGPKDNCHWWCSNQYQEMLRSHQSKGNIIGAILLVRQFLTSWNVHSLRVTLDHIKHMEIKEDKKPVGVTDGSFNMRFLRDMFYDGEPFEYGKEIAHAQTCDGL
jgi:hypothetical protein